MHRAFPFLDGDNGLVRKIDGMPLALAPMTEKERGCLPLHVGIVVTVSRLLEVSHRNTQGVIEHRIGYWPRVHHHAHPTYFSGNARQRKAFRSLGRTSFRLGIAGREVLTSC